ncbi:MAG: transglycosylase domain-containing protein, partial [Phycicoccus sp.]
MSQAVPRTRAEAGTRADQPPSGRTRTGGVRLPWWRTWLRRAGWAALAVVLLGIVGIGIAYAMIDVPDANESATAEASIVYFSDGKTEMARLSDPEGNRESVELRRVPEHVQNAFLAAEDKDFYENSGVSPTGIARAVWVAVKGGEATQGGSTITQQYVKNYFLTSDRTIQRKAREILLAVKIGREQSKQEILGNYLNTIYFGRGAYGIQTASKAYFGKDVSTLTPAEGAFLATVIRGPSLYDPGIGKEQAANAEERSGFILDAMVAQGWLTAAERDKAVFPAKSFKAYKPRSQGGVIGYVVDVVKKELVNKHKLTDNDIQRGGLRVVSTIDLAKQRLATDAIREEQPKEKDIQAGLVSITPGDGAVVALYGGRDFATRPQNSATQDKMPAGSTFKIFTLIAALQNEDISLRSRFDGGSPQFFDEFASPDGATEDERRGRVKNFGDESYGRISVVKATEDSVNTVYAQMNIETGPEKAKKAAEDAGVRSKLESNMGNVLGTDYVTVMDMASAYATIAAQGVRAEPYLVKQIRFPDADRAPTIDVVPRTERVFEEDVMADVITAMQAPVEDGTARYIGRNLDRPAAGKTGTSESFRSAWFDGYVPQLATAVGLYRSGPKGEELQMEDLPSSGDITGGTFPSRIWTAYMEAALDGTEEIDFPEPANVNRDADPPPPPPDDPAPAP